MCSGATWEPELLHPHCPGVQFPSQLPCFKIQDPGESRLMTAPLDTLRNFHAVAIEAAIAALGAPFDLMVCFIPS